MWLYIATLTYAELKEKEKVSEGSAKDEPDHGVITVAPLQTSTHRDTSPRLGSQPTSDKSGIIDRSQATTSVVGSRPRAATVGALPSKEAVEKHGSSSKSSPLQQNLDKIMANLDMRRKSAGRPDDMTVRNRYQVNA